MKKSAPLTAGLLLVCACEVIRTGPGTQQGQPTAQPVATSTDPTAAGPTAAGPTAAGPTSAGPTATGPTATGPTATGPTATGPTATATGPTATSGPTSGTTQQGTATATGQATAPAPTREQMEQDARELHGAAEQAEALGNRSDFTLSDTVSPSLRDMEAKLAKINEVLQVVAVLRPAYQRFVQRYVAPLRPDQDANNELNNRFQGIVSWRVGPDYWAVRNKIEEADHAIGYNATRCADVLEQFGTDASYIRALNPMFRTRNLVMYRAMLDMCPRFRPGDAQIVQRMEALRPRVVALLDQFREEEMAAIREVQWQGDSGPGGFRQQAQQFLRDHEAWGGNARRGTRVLAVSVRGAWFVAERNIFGQPTKYGLPVHVAILTNDAPEGTAQVFELSLITARAQQRPPFEGYWVGRTWQILRERVPGN